MDISTLRDKRATLQSGIPHLVGQINRINGAIAQLDELIAEAEAQENAERILVRAQALNTEPAVDAERDLKRVPREDKSFSMQPRIEEHPAAPERGGYIADETDAA